MPVYWMFVIAAIVVAIFAGRIDEKVNANGKLKKVVVVFSVGIAIILSMVIKLSL